MLQLKTQIIILFDYDGELKNNLTVPNITITGWFYDQKRGLA
jgi:hypothetical protein